MRVETYGQSRPQEGRQQTQNQDAYVIGQGPFPYVALCDGAGNAQGVAKRALSLLQAFLKEATLGEVLREETWIRWTKSLDSALLGGAETTLVAAAALGNQVTGVVVGDSRGYVVPLDGPTDLATSSASKARLGSGEAEAVPWRVILRPRDVVVLLSDGAWGPVGTPGVEKAVRSAVLKHFSEVPQALLDSAAKRGRADDMTAVALRLMSS